MFPELSSCWGRHVVELREERYEVSTGGNQRYEVWNCCNSRHSTGETENFNCMLKKPTVLFAWVFESMRRLSWAWPHFEYMFLILRHIKP